MEVCYSFIIHLYYNFICTSLPPHVVMWSDVLHDISKQGERERKKITISFSRFSFYLAIISIETSLLRFLIICSLKKIIYKNEGHIVSSNLHYWTFTIKKNSLFCTQYEKFSSITNNYMYAANHSSAISVWGGGGNTRFSRSCFISLV